ncbi:hypothetical protein [Tessaracoccus flavus]|nr:hypothetical protein [Tessaracoccus flavus]
MEHKASNHLTGDMLRLAVRRVTIQRRLNGVRMALHLVTDGLCHRVQTVQFIDTQLTHREILFEQMLHVQGGAPDQGLKEGLTFGQSFGLWGRE